MLAGLTPLRLPPAQIARVGEEHPAGYLTPSTKSPKSDELPRDAKVT